MTCSPETVIARWLTIFGKPYANLKAEAINAALRAAGYRIVPAEPTKEQCEAAHTVIAGDDGGIPEVYRAMLAAAEESGHE